MGKNSINKGYEHTCNCIGCNHLAFVKDSQTNTWRCVAHESKAKK